jgi:hypothetical protein
VVAHRVRRHWPGWSAGDCRKADGGINAQRAAALDGPFIVLFDQDRADEANKSVFVGEDADDLGASLDLCR